MSEDAAPATSSGSNHSSQVLIRPYSDVIYLYPSLLLSIACGAWVSMSGAVPPPTAGLLFTLFFFFNLTIVAFDYTRLTSVVIILVFVILGLLSSMYPVVSDGIKAIFDQHVEMNASFYWVWSVCLGLLLLGVFVRTRFDYWEIKNNELLHHHGLLGDVERWPAPNMRISKEIRDVMEFALLRAGRLVLVPAREPRAIVIDNVPNINRVESEMQRLLSMLRVADGD